MAETQGFEDRFSQVGTAWFIADYAFDHHAFDTDWSRSNVKAEDGLSLSLAPQYGAGNRFSGASIRRQTPSQYGRYEITMQAARGDGLVTGFFTYTGPYYGTRHDEIDIEILGRDTTRLHAAWFVDGTLTSRFIDLGFDAAEDPHRFAFEWWPDRLRWFADGRLVFEHRAEEGAMPEVAGRLYANLWAAAPALENWAGRTNAQTRGHAHIHEIRFIPMADLVKTPSG